MMRDNRQVFTREDHWLEWGGSGATLHFAHGNGFPPAAYRSVLEPLSTHFRVVSWEARALWKGSDPQAIRSWKPLAKDLRGVLWSRGLRRVLGVGHSLGAVLSLIAAARQPELFAGLVLIDPVVFTGMRARGWALMKALGRAHRLYLVRGARGRREHWPDRETARSVWTDKKAFAGWVDGALDDYVRDGLVDDPEGGLRLRYPRAWEARIFEVTPHDVWNQVRSVPVPILAIRGETSDAFLKPACRRLARDARDARVLEVEGAGHMVPMQRPRAVVEAICHFAHEVV